MESTSCGWFSGERAGSRLVSTLVPPETSGRRDESRRGTLKRAPRQKLRRAFNWITRAPRVLVNLPKVGLLMLVPRPAKLV